MITLKAVKRIDALFAIERGLNDCSAAERLEVRPPNRQLSRECTEPGHLQFGTKTAATLAFDTGSVQVQVP